MTNDEAREYFKNKGLDYSVLNKKNTDRLRDILKDELEKFIIDNGLHWIKIRQRCTKDGDYLGDHGFFNISCRSDWFQKKTSYNI